MVAGCTYNDAASNTQWQGSYTVWFPVTQGIGEAGNPGVISQIAWTGIGTGNAVWDSLAPSPAPYLILTNWSDCGSLTWFEKSNIAYPLAPVYLQQPDVAAMIQTSLAEFHQALVMGNLTPTDNTRSLAIAALVIASGSFILGIVACVVALSLSSKLNYKRQVDVPMTSPSL